MAESQAQKKATQKWNKENREHRSYLSARGTARSFIRNKATKEDLLELKAMIESKLAE